MNPGGHLFLFPHVLEVNTFWKKVSYLSPTTTFVKEKSSQVMQTKRSIPILLAILLTKGCFAGQIDKLSDGIGVHLKQPARNGARQIKLQVVSDKVIQVIATPGESFPGISSLMAVNKQGNSIQWDAARPDHQHIAGKMITYNGIAQNGPGHLTWTIFPSKKHSLSVYILA